MFQASLRSFHSGNSRSAAPEEDRISARFCCVLPRVDGKKIGQKKWKTRQPKPVVLGRYVYLGPGVGASTAAAGAVNITGGAALLSPATMGGSGVITHPIQSQTRERAASLHSLSARSRNSIQSGSHSVLLDDGLSLLLRNVFFFFFLSLFF